MTLPTAQAAVDDLRHAHREFLRVVDSLADADWERYVPYGEWTVKDLIAHVIGDMSPSGPGLILAGILTPEFIADTSRTFDIRSRNAGMVAERRSLSREDLRQMLFECHDAKIAAALKLSETHLPVLGYAVPMGPGYELRVEDWLWAGYHERQHGDDIRRALAIDYAPEELAFLPEIEERMRALVRSQDGLLRAAYSVADEAWSEQSEAAPGWTYHDLLAHVCSNEARLQIRLRSAMGEATTEELAAINDIDGWNARSVAERREWTASRLVGEFLAGRHETLRVLARFQPQHLSGHVVLGGERGSVPVLEFIDRISNHTSTHAGQLVPASRARRSAR